MCYMHCFEFYIVLVFKHSWNICFYVKFILLLMANNNFMRYHNYYRRPIEGYVAYCYKQDYVVDLGLHDMYGQVQHHISRD